MMRDMDQPPTQGNDIATEFEWYDLAESEGLAQPATLEDADLVLEEITDRDTGLGRTVHQLQDESAAGPAPTGGDIDADQYQSKVSGEEAVGGTTPTPDQNIVEELATSVGIKNLDGHPLRTMRILQSRDSHRWELEPDSAENYPEDD